MYRALRHPDCHNYVGSRPSPAKKECLPCWSIQGLEFYASQTYLLASCLDIALDWASQVMSLPRRDIVPVDPARDVAEQDPPSRPAAQPSQPPQPSMHASQLVQWLSVQAGNMAGDL